MDILYLIIPLSLILVAIIVAAFMWAIRSGQFDDLEGPAHRILLDDDEEPAPGGDGGISRLSDDDPERMR
ncbi:MAG: cbb3-type cytochrome oxidase assembly protein CcoS [Gammaproteobacteria bacterium]|nr:cbb3-type cytochrome oxidase assembly protein CcoS [Gammaproteobacteria bacterium]